MLKLIALLSLIGVVVFHAAYLIVPTGQLLAWQCGHEWAWCAIEWNWYAFWSVVVPTVLKS